MRFALLAILLLALAPANALAQSEHQPPPHIKADDIALGFISGRYVMPVTCKLLDGSSVEVEDSIQLKASPEASGGSSLRVTFFGIEVPNAEYCYSPIERRVVDRRGIFFVDFRRVAKAGPLTYNAHRGELREKPIGSDAAAQEPRVLEFDGGDARLVVESIAGGTDGAKVVTQFLEKHPPKPGLDRRIFTFRFIAKDSSEFIFYAIEDDRRFR
jgi:hypothetical protein